MCHSWNRAAVAIIMLFILVTVYQQAVAKAANLPHQQGLSSDILSTSEVSAGTAEANFNPGRLLLKMLLGLVTVLGLLFLVGKVLSGRLGLPPGNARYLAVLDTLPLGTGKGLIVVQAGNKHYLLGVSGERISLLKELESADLVVSSLETPGFATVLSQTQKTNQNNWQQAADLIRRQVMSLRRSEHGENKGEGE